ncbi:hypothetical protein [Ekhidna sp.]
MLANGESLSGEFNYNFITGILSHRTQNNSTPYSARTIRKFVLRNNDLIEKKFYSIPFEIDKPNRKQPIFFEVIYQKENVAILSRHGYDYKERGVGNTDPNGVYVRAGTQTRERITEFIYLADDKGNIFLYAKAKKDKYKTFQLDSGFGRKNDSPQNSYSESKTNRTSELKYKITDSDAISLLTKSHYYKLKKYIKQKDLDLKTIKGLTTLFNYYTSIN